MLSVAVTWLEGPDVMMVLASKKDKSPKERNNTSDEGFMLYEQVTTNGNGMFGYCGNGSMSLTAEEAETLGKELLNAAAKVKQNREELKQYMEKSK